MNPEQRAKLNDYIDENSTVDLTDTIRESKRSVLVKRDVERMLLFKQIHGNQRLSNTEEFNRKCATECPFLVEEMSFLYEKLRDDKIEMSVFWTFLKTLESIESGELDQHDASYKIGELLKRMYIDTVISGGESNEPKNNISWSDYNKNNR